MSRKLILLNLALLAIAGWLGWTLRIQWLDAQAKERAIFQRAARAKAVLPPPPLPQMRPVMPAEYIDVAQKMLFSKDRNPNVVIETPPPKPEPPMPALPFYYGEMTIGDPIVLLSVTNNGVQKSYHAGEKIGPFELVSFDREKITLNWNGKTVEKKLDELRPKDAPQPQQVAPVAAQAPAAPSLVKSLGLSLAASPEESKNPQLGQDMGGGFRACAKGDNSPAGTVLDGYKKVISNTLMGESCFWEKANK
jgi:hypothetical protein